MYKNHLDTAIRNRTLPKSLLLYGDEFFSSFYRKIVLPIFGEKDGVLSFYFDEYSYESAKNFISQASLFGDKNILYIRGDKKIPKKELDTLVSLCQKNETSYFLYQFSGEDKVAKDLSKSFTKKKMSDFVRFFKPNLGEALNILKAYADKLKLDIDNFALQHLFMIQSEDLSLSLNELKKLSILNKKIEAADIDKHVFGMGEISMDDFIAKLLDKEDIRDTMQTMIENNYYDEIKVINTIQAYLVQLLMFHIYIKVHGSYDVLDILGFPLPQNLAKIRAAQSIKINLQTYQSLTKHLLDTEHALKLKPNIDKKAYIYSSLIKMQTLL